MISDAGAPPQPPAQPLEPKTLPPVRLAWAIVAAAAAGVALLLAFPPYDLWWLAPVGVGALAVAVHRRSIRNGGLLGALTGLVFFVPLLSWSNLEVGYAPWVLLSVLQAGYVALLGMGLALLSPVADRWRASWPLLVALGWVAQEALRSRTPFGGFPWGRLAFSQGDSPLLPLATLGGAPLVSFAVALTGGLLVLLVWRSWRPLLTKQVMAAARVAAAAALVLLSGLAVPASTPAGQPVTVAVVQGNVPRLGLDFASQRQAVLNNHVNATLRLAEQVAAGEQEQPELVIWPENSSDIDPIANVDAGQRISQAATEIGAPILVGAVLRQDGQLRNTALVWQPQQGPSQVYAKRHPVPFAEYWPLESVTYPIARALTEAADRVAGFQAGNEPGVLTMGPAVIGNVICFEVAYDAVVRDAVVEGGQLFTVQTNNATFNEAEARQQMAMVRLRAVEHGRWSLMASTVGVSGFVDPYGEVYDETGFFTPDVLVRTLVLSDERTLAATIGVWPEVVLVTGASAALVLALRLRRRAGTTTQTPMQAKRGNHDQAAR